MRDLGADIIRCTDLFEYEYSGKHTYNPDFIVNGEYIDVKGSQFINEDGTLRNPYDKTEQGQLQCKAKYACMLANNVKLVLEEFINTCKLFVNSKYGETYIDQFEIKYEGGC